MREIKFRCWDGRCMLYFDLQDIEASDSLSHGKEFQLNDTLMQFTGLKDKNGKEIYEGDIVKPSYDASSDYLRVEWGGPWEQCAFGITAKRKEKRFQDDTEYSWDTLNLNFGLHLEVIGNIYENPELAGGTQKGLDLEG